jgi:hypothetical protein
MLTPWLTEGLTFLLRMTVRLMRRVDWTLDREAHAAGRLDVLSAWAVRSEEQPLLGWKTRVYLKRNHGLY